MAAPTFDSAKELAAKGRVDQAMAQLDQLAKQSPEPAGVERLRGLILYQREQFTDAIEAFTKAEAQDPTDHESTEMHGVSLFRAGRTPEAIPFLEKGAHAGREREHRSRIMCWRFAMRTCSGMTIHGVPLRRSLDLSRTRRRRTCWRDGCFCGASFARKRGGGCEGA